MSKSPSLRRIQADVRELALDPSDRYYAAPLEDDMFEWHFTIRGADDTDFAGGVYHGRILLPPEYPFKPPHIVFLTPSGRFETNTKVCLSFSAYHPELWQPAWGIRLILEALISFLPTPADGAIGALDWTAEERKRLAKKSLSYTCPRCGKATALLPQVKPDKKVSSKFEKEIEQLRLLQIQHETKPKKEENGEAAVEKENGETKVEEENEEDTKEPPMEHVQEEPPMEHVQEEPAVVPRPDASPPRVTPTEGTDTTTTNAEPPVQQAGGFDVFFLTDPIVHAIIVVLAILCALLVRKWMALAEELRTLPNAGL